MKRIIASLVIGVSALSGQAFALVGGPFDGNSHSSALERNSIYQGTLSLLNGSGYVYFSPDAKITSDRIPGGTPNLADFDLQGSTPNRSVIYYKGVTYVGGCYGTVDMDARFVTAAINGSSEVGFSVAQTSSNAGAAAASSSLAISSIVVQSNKSFIVNGFFEGKISQTAPIFRFRGQGQLAFLTPTSSDSIGNLAYEAFSGMIGAVISFVGNSVVAGNGNDFGDIFTDGEAAITQALADLLPYLDVGGIDSADENSVKVKIKVSGTRRYL